MSNTATPACWSIRVPTSASRYGDAFGLVARSGRAERARAMVEQRYSIETMAAQLVELYRPTMAMR